MNTFLGVRVCVRPPCTTRLARSLCVADERVPAAHTVTRSLLGVMMEVILSAGVGEVVSSSLFKVVGESLHRV